MRIVREMKAQIILSAGALSFNPARAHARLKVAPENCTYLGSVN